jgi:hypothetical protein
MKPGNEVTEDGRLVVDVNKLWRRVNPELRRLLDASRTHVMTPEERRAQAISFAYGNLAIDRPETRREDVEASYDRLYPMKHIIVTSENGRMVVRGSDPEVDARYQAMKRRLERQPLDEIRETLDRSGTVAPANHLILNPFGDE